MKNKYKVLEGPRDTEIICDNKHCDFKALSVPDRAVKAFMNVECPRCGDVLLTKEDYAHFVVFRKIMGIINVLCFPFMFVATILRGSKNEGSYASYHHHNGKTTIKTEKYDLEDEWTEDW